MNNPNLTRKAYQSLLFWKNHLADRYALLLEGARRVGKTHLLQDFARREYASSIYIDFSQRSSLASASRVAFTEEADVKGLLERLSILYGTRLIPGKSCLVFDEIQQFPTAREMIKGLVAHGKYHYIESGSLVGIKENTRSIVIPSEEHSLKLHPLDFEEFLWALGEHPLAEAIRSAYTDLRPLPKAIHEKALCLFRKYLVVGGMPQALLAFLGGGDDRIERAEIAKREILSLYDKDIGKYARGYAAKVRSIFKHLASALNSREKRFQLADLAPGARLRRYENAFLWLSDAMLVNMVYNASSPEIGLQMNLESTLFKCYCLDTGLLVTQAMSGATEVDSRLLRALLYDKIGVNEGMFFENMVAQALAANGHELFFFARKDRSEPKSVMEIDFLIQNGIKVSPIEVKSAQYHRHASLDRFIAAYPRHLGTKFVICPGNLELKDGIQYLPAYMVHLLH